MAWLFIIHPAYYYSMMRSVCDDNSMTYLGLLFFRIKSHVSNAAQAFLTGQFSKLVFCIGVLNNSLLVPADFMPSDFCCFAIIV